MTSRTPALSELQEAAEALGIALTEQALQQFERFLVEIANWRTRASLIGPGTAGRIVESHFVDSLLLLAEASPPVAARIIDVGTGAGFPGVVLKIARPDLELVLVESRRKKVAFLEHLRDALGHRDIRVEWARAEALGRQRGHRESYDVAVTRATARLVVAAELCLPLVRVSGFSAVMKGPRAPVEIAEARPLIAALGGELESSHERQLPGSHARRVIVVIRKLRESPARFPRSGVRIGALP